MKIKSKIEDITHNDLVNLIATATFESIWLSFQYDKSRCRNLEDGDCSEDIAAKILLDGGTIEFIDDYAEDPADVYSKTGYFETDAAIYPVTFTDIKRGLERALNGNFKDSSYYENTIAEKVLSLCEEESDFDNEDAEMLMQIILFNEIVY